MIIRLPKLLRHELASALFVGAGIWLFGILIKFPQGLLTTSHFPRLGDYLKLCANPFARDVNPVLAYRISVPVLAWALHLAPIICTILPILFLTDLFFHQDVWRGVPNSFAGFITVLFFSAAWALILAALAQWNSKR